MWDFLQYQDRIAAVDEDGQEISYKELEEEGKLLADRIGERGLVFISCTNQIGCLLGYTACIKNRIVPVMLADSIDAGLQKELEEQYHPNYIWKPSELVTLDEKEVFGLRGYSLVELDVKSHTQLLDDLALLLTTSGSTGSQKLVRISYQNLESNTKSIVKYLKLTKEERPILALPMSYTYGLSIVNTHLFVGAMLLLSTKKVIQKAFWNFFRKYEGTSFSGVPHTYEVLDKIHFEQMELKSLRTLTQAGGKLGKHLQEVFGTYAKEKNVNFVVMYGQTEATARISYLPPERCLDKLGSIGIAIPGGTISLLDKDGNPIQEANMEGELVYEGKNVTLGYATCTEDLKKGDERNGKLFTGDMGYMDEEGFLYVTGRRDRYMKVFGNRVSLDEVEMLVKSGMGIEEAACVGKDEQIYIFLSDELRAEEVRNFLSETTKLNKSAFHTKKIAKIPRSESGKVRYKQLKEALEE